ncbi:MAG TPA: hypothetical protein V6D14_05005 [Coleofasciculaceae cyanobacterium]
MKYFLSWGDLLMDVLAIGLILGLGRCGDSLGDSFSSRSFLTSLTQSLGLTLNSAATYQGLHFS